MRKVFTILLSVLILTANVLPVAAAEETPPTIPDKPVIFTELQTSSAVGASEKFITIYNNADEPVDVTGWQIQYRPATNSSDDAWKAKATVACIASTDATCRVVLAPEQWLLFSSYDTQAQVLTATSAFAITGGQIRLVQPGTTPIIHDVLNYGVASTIDGNTPAVAPSKGKSLQRRVGEDGLYSVTSSNATDFAQGCAAPTPGQWPTELAPTPAECNASTDPGSDNPDPADDTAADPLPEGDTAGIYLPLTITELLPDPASPQTDSNDEFIELYNPSNVAVSVGGYELQSGSSYRYKYVLPDQSIEPGEYITITSAESHLSLTNTGTSVRLLDPNGVVVDEVVNYGAAKAGQSWMRGADGVWQWTTTPTAGGANALVAAVAKVKAASTKKASTVKKPAKSTAKKLSASKATNVSTPIASNAADASQPASLPNFWLLGAIGALVVGYAAYEYRGEIGQKLGVLRAKFTGQTQ